MPRRACGEFLPKEEAAKTAKAAEEAISVPEGHVGDFHGVTIEGIAKMLGKEAEDTSVPRRACGEFLR